MVQELYQGPLCIDLAGYLNQGASQYPKPWNRNNAMELLESPFQSIENSVVWLLVVFSICVLGLILMERAGAARVSKSNVE